VYHLTGIDRIGEQPSQRCLGEVSPDVRRAILRGPGFCLSPPSLKFRDHR
jgi:hypothetical protein